MALESLLKEELQKNPEKYSLETIKRVSELVKIIDSKSKNTTPYRLFKSIEDYYLYSQINPALKGMNTVDLQKGKSEQNRFYHALYEWVRKEAKGNKNYQRELMNRVIPRIRRDWQNFEKVNDWKDYYLSHPEWKGKTTVEMQKSKDGLYAFYMACRDWAKESAKGNKKVQKELMRKVFPQIREGWANCQTLNDWIKYKDEHPEWKGYNTSQMHKNSDLKGDKFYIGFRNWVEREARGDVKYKKKLMNALFPRTKLDWTDYTKLIDWKKVYNSHPEWKGKNANTIRKDIENNGNKFYLSFNKWTNQESKGDVEYKKFLVNEMYNK